MRCTPGRWCSIFTVSAMLGVALHGGAARAQPGAVPQRVLILDIDSRESNDPAVVAVPELIARIISQHPGFEIIPRATARDAVARITRTQPACAAVEACRRQLAADLHANIVVSSALAKDPPRYVLFLAVTRAGASATSEASRTSEPMKFLKSLPRNVELCLNRIFPWSQEPGTASTSVGADAPDRPEPPGGVSASPPPAAATSVPSPVKPPERPARLSLAILAVTPGEGFTSGQVRTIESLLVEALHETGRLKVVGQADIDAILTLEARKQAVDCKDDTNCMVQIAGALGVDLAAVSDVGRLGKNVVLSINVIDVRRGTVAARSLKRVASDDALPDAVQDLAADVVHQVYGETGAVTTSAAPRPATVQAQQRTSWTSGDQKGSKAPEPAPLPPGAPSAGLELSTSGPVPVETKTDSKSGLEFVHLPGGSYHFGCESGDPECHDDERPGRPVSVPAFWMGKTHVTVEAYARCVSAGRCTPPNTGGKCNWDKSARMDHPINCLDWRQATAFCEWIGGRLPSAEEWEYAAKSGESRIYPWGNTPPDVTRACYDSSCGSGTWPAVSFGAGATKHGLLNMVGNVVQWTATDADSDDKEIRGGSWSNIAAYIRISRRDQARPNRRDDHIGFRCAF